MNSKKRGSLFAVVLAFVAFFSQGLLAKGKLELGFHFSSWSIDILRSTIENALSDSMDTEMRDNFMEELQKDHPDFVETSYSQSVEFDSGGTNFGFEIRWYPSGEQGSYSFGFSIEKTSMRFSLTEISGNLEVEDSVTHETGSFKAKASGEVLVKPLSFHLSMRWDIKPSWRVRPYITFGVGVSTASAINNASFSYSYTGDLTIPGEPPEHYQDSETKTGKELKEEAEAEGENFPMTVIPFIQLNFGIKGALTENLYILGDFGIWDGLLFRCGIAYRF